MLFLIGAGLIATQAARVDWKNLRDHIQIGDDEGLDEIFGGSTFDYSDELSQEFQRAAACTSTTIAARLRSTWPTAGQ